MPASGGRHIPYVPTHTYVPGWHGTPLVDTDSVLAVPQSFHVPAGGVATDSQVSYMLANGSITNPTNDADAAASGGAGHDEAASTRPASPQPDPVHSVHTLANGSDSLWHVHGSAPSTSDFVVVQAEVQAEAEASHAPWPWPMDRRPE